MNEMTEKKIDYNDITTGYEFEPAEIRLSSESVLKYLDAVEGDRHIYEENNIVPPMAVAALAMTAMAKGLSMPPGAVHVSQDLQFLRPVGFNENVTSYAKVNRRVQRGKINMMTIGINVFNKNNELVITGETSFILPAS